MDPWAVVSRDTDGEGDCKKLVSQIHQVEPTDLVASIGESVDGPQTGTRPDSNNLFEDHFLPPDSVARPEDQFHKLPDTHVYLASLENKLEKLQKGKDTTDGLIESLQQTREASMVNLLTTNSQLTSLDPTEFDELRVNPILKKLIPEKQALTVEELIHLVQADQLSQTTEPETAEEEIVPTADVITRLEEN